MSYILDALKASDQQRRELPVEPQEQVLAAVPVAPRQRGRGHTALRWGLVLLAGLALGAYLLQAVNSPESPETESTVPVALSAPLTPAAEALSESRTALPAGATGALPARPVEGIAAPLSKAVVVEEPDRLEAQALSGVKLVLERPAVAAPASIRSATSPATPTPRTADPAARTAVPAGASAGSAASRPPAAATVAEAVTPAVDPYAGLPYLRQLPVEIQRELPPLAVSVHIYSEQRSGRMVKLNDRMVVEGQRIAGGLQIEAIIPRAVVLSYKEYRFKLPTLQ